MTDQVPTSAARHARHGNCAPCSVAANRVTLCLRRYIGRYSTREEAERVSARYGDSLYPNRTVEPEEVGRRVDWLIWTVPDA